MKKYFCRELNSNYLVLTDWETGKDTYELPMLEHNEIPGLLPLQVRQSGQGKELYYRITSRQTIARMYDQKQIDSGLIERLLMQIRRTAETLQQYLLSDSGLLLSPDEIYTDPDSGRFWMVYVPGGDGEETPLLALAEFLLKRLKHSDSKAVALGYSFYQQAGTANCNLKECLTKVFFQAEREEAEKAARAAKAEPTSPGQIPPMPPGEQAVPSRNRLQAVSPRNKLQTASPRNRLQAEKRIAGPGKKPEKSGWHKALALTVLFVFLSGVYGLIIWWFAFDLTQAGGLAFFMIASVWLAGIVITGRNRKQEDWKWALSEDQEEDAYLAEVFEQVDREDREKEQQRVKQGRAAGTRKDETPEPETEPEEDTCRTRFLGTDSGNLFLKSTEPDFYGDLVIRSSPVQIGKKGGGADLLLPSDAVSRMHARLESTQAGWQVTDLNSMNGTYINEVQLQPNETRILREGDRLRFADLTYRYCAL